MKVYFYNKEVWIDKIDGAIELDVPNDYELCDFNDVGFDTVKYKTRKNKDKITELKQQLANTDYKALKYVDGEITQEEYAPIWTQRKEWRKQINELEKEI